MGLPIHSYRQHVAACGASRCTTRAATPFLEPRRSTMCARATRTQSIFLILPVSSSNYSGYPILTFSKGLPDCRRRPRQDPGTISGGRGFRTRASWRTKAGAGGGKPGVCLSHPGSVEGANPCYWICATRQHQEVRRWSFVPYTVQNLPTRSSGYLFRSANPPFAGFIYRHYHPFHHRL